MNSIPSHVTAVAYQVRTGIGGVLGRYSDHDTAAEFAEFYAHDGYRTHVTFVELIDGVWTAPED